MTKHISILRGINVGGKRKILMADLKALYADLGFENIISYIQSGNVIFESEGLESNAEIAVRIAEAITDKYGFDVPVIVRSVSEIRTAFAENPFLKNGVQDIKKLHLTFLAEAPDNESLEKIKTFDYSPDRFEIIGKDVYLLIEEKYHKSKLSNNFFEKKLKVAATTRNWKTVTKLLELSV